MKQQKTTRPKATKVAAIKLQTGLNITKRSNKEDLCIYGDGDFTTGTYTLVNAAYFAANTVTFNNVVWDAEGNSSDVFILLINNRIPGVALVANAGSKAAVKLSCPDVAGALIFTDDATRPSEKYLAVYPNGNTGYNFSATAENNNPAINNQRKTNSASATSALSNRIYVINDAGSNNYPSGMKLRLYYNAADSAAAVAALDPADVLAAQTVNTVTGAVWLTSAAYGVENGVNYVEFGGISSFGTFGALGNACRINSSAETHQLQWNHKQLHGQAELGNGAGRKHKLF